MCSDGLFDQYFLLSSVAAGKCQMTTGAKFSVHVP